MHLYQSPLKVYLGLGLLALWGIFCGLELPISLFPNSSKPNVNVSLQFEGLGVDEFYNRYGVAFESALRKVAAGRIQIDKLTARYRPGGVDYNLDFAWGTPNQEALREVEVAAQSFAARLPEFVRNSMWVGSWGDSPGITAVSFFSPNRSQTDIYNILDPLITPLATQIPDASEIQLWNPEQREVRIELSPDKMAQLQILPRDLETALVPALTSRSGGNLNVGPMNLDVLLAPQIKSLESLSQMLVSSRSGRAVHLGDIAKISLDVPLSRSRLIKTSGASSVLLVASPKPGGNVKQLADSVIKMVKQVKASLPADVGYKVLIDPSEFIRSAVGNLMREVLLAALLAVGVLFLFVGNLRNVITAAIEIPLSIVLALILMRLTGVSINLISLGGLALSAGMNVDGSVVVMENIFRHFDAHKGRLTAADRLRIVLAAVSEVRLPLIASTIASIVVFLPLAMTRDLTNAILGDLALAVVYSHGCSALVALVLVPTVRLQMFSADHSPSPVEGWLGHLERTYGQALERFLRSKQFVFGLAAALTLALVLLAGFLLPRLPRQIIGKPDTDWIVMRISSRDFNSIRQMESLSDETEAQLLRDYPKDILYTFTQINGPNNTQIMARLRDKSKMESMWKALENKYVSTPVIDYKVSSWNPAELRIPSPPALQISVRGQNTKDRTLAANLLLNELRDRNIFSGGVWSNINSSPREGLRLKPLPELWSALRESNLQATDVADLVRLATVGSRLPDLVVDDRPMPATMSFARNPDLTVSDVSSLPIGVKGRLVPARALVDFVREPIEPDLFKENDKEVVQIFGDMKKEDEAQGPSQNKKAQEIVAQFVKKNLPAGVTVTVDDAAKELTDALGQLISAIALSVLLIFVTMIFQLGNVVSGLLVLLAVPLGFIGVIAGLWIFSTPVSLNSALGVILLNGIAVANSVILVDCMKRKFAEGLTPEQAALSAATTRFRPILMTSLTTALGMFPIALGMGEGGKILQPLGIAVLSGLASSVLMTLFFVPTFQAYYLEWHSRRKLRRSSPTQLTNHNLNVREHGLAYAHKNKNNLEKDLDKNNPEEKRAAWIKKASETFPPTI